MVAPVSRLQLRSRIFCHPMATAATQLHRSDLSATIWYPPPISRLEALLGDTEPQRPSWPSGSLGGPPAATSALFLPLSLFLFLSFSLSYPVFRFSCRNHPGLLLVRYETFRISRFSMVSKTWGKIFSYMINQFF